MYVSMVNNYVSPDMNNKLMCQIKINWKFSLIRSPHIHRMKKTKYSLYFIVMKKKKNYKNYTSSQV